MEQPETLDEESPKVREIEPLFHPCNRLEALAPLRWLRLGWQDLRRAPRLSIPYGLVVTALCFLMSWLAWGEGNSMALFTIGIGIILLAAGLLRSRRLLRIGLLTALLLGLWAWLSKSRVQSG